MVTWFARAGVDMYGCSGGVLQCAAAERVFSLLKLMLGDTQMSALADMIQAVLTLKKKRKVG